MLSPDDLKTVLASPVLRQAHGLELPQDSLTTLAVDGPAFANFYTQWTAEGQPRYAPPTPAPAQVAAPVAAPVAPMAVAPVPTAVAAPVAPTPPMSPYGPPPTPQFPTPQVSSAQLSPYSRDPSALATNVGYTDFMNSPNAVRPTGLNRPGTSQMFRGFGIALIGVIITAVTWAIAAPGGTFVVAWGAIVFGTIRGIMGAVRMSRGE
jgi:hypothetical protein